MAKLNSVLMRKRNQLNLFVPKRNHSMYLYLITLLKLLPVIFFKKSLIWMTCEMREMLYHYAPTS